MPDYAPMSFEQGVSRIIKNLVDKPWTIIV
jgi:hypothetical protein